MLDDSLRYVERAVAAGVDVSETITHGLLSGIGMLAASSQAFAAIGALLADRLLAPSK